MKIMYRDCNNTDRGYSVEFPKLKVLCRERVLYINTKEWLISYKKILECCNIKYYRRYGIYA